MPVARTKPAGKKTSRTKAVADGSVTLAQRAYELLKAEILSEKIEEGQFVDVEAILARYLIGRTPFREACQRLSHEQLVDLVPRRGLMIRELSLRDARDLLEARAKIEPEIVALAALRRTDEEIAELETIDLSMQGLLADEGESCHVRRGQRPVPFKDLRNVAQPRTGCDWPEPFTAHDARFVFADPEHAQRRFSRFACRYHPGHQTA